MSATCANLAMEWSIFHFKPLVQHQKSHSRTVILYHPKKKKAHHNIYRDKGIVTVVVKNIKYSSRRNKCDEHKSH